MERGSERSIGTLPDSNADCSYIACVLVDDEFLHGHEDGWCQKTIGSVLLCRK